MRKLWAALAFTTALIAAPALRAESLADALISAYRTSNLLEQNQAVLRAADEDAAIALSQLRPVVNFAAQGSWTKNNNDTGGGFFDPFPMPYYEETGASLSLTAEILVYAGGRGKMGVDVAHEAVLATRASLVNVEQEVLLDAVAAYVDIRLQNALLELARSSVDLIGQELQAARDRFDVGEITLTDVSQAEARLASAEADVTAAEANVLVARERYKATIGHYPDSLSGLPDLPKTAKSKDEATRVALASHPYIIQSQHEAAVAELQTRIAEAAFLPTVTGQMQGVAGVDGGNGTYNYGNVGVGLRLSQPIYQGGGLSALYRQALARKAAADAGLHQSAVVVGENVGRAWARVTSASSLIDARNAQVEAARKAFEGVSEEATLGARTTLDVLNAQLELQLAQANTFRARADEYTAAYALLSTMGLLTAEHLKLGIPTFDPEAYYNQVKRAPATSPQGAKLDRIMKSVGND